uniref:Uncharacterized protein n=1 Tax=viral metagenome TaxID=1070528 RepID=A0A6M3LIN6_9ZZZZ
MKLEVKPLIILGMGVSHYACPYDKEVWGVNLVYKFAKRLDLLFFFDHPDNEGCINWKEFAELDVPKMSFWDLEGFKNVSKYPLKEVIEHFNTRYFANSICWMLALALYKGYNHIEMYGVDHSAQSEYVLAKGCVEYWIGRAQQSGVKVLLPKKSALCKTLDGKLYGIHGKVASAEDVFLGH